MGKTSGEPTVLVVDDDPSIRELLLLARERGARVPGVVAIDIGLRLVAKCSSFQLDIGFGESPHDRGSIVRVRGRRVGQLLEVLDLRDEKLDCARPRPRSAIVANRSQLNRRRR